MKCRTTFQVVDVKPIAFSRDKLSVVQLNRMNNTDYTADFYCTASNLLVKKELRSQAGSLRYNGSQADSLRYSYCRLCFVCPCRSAVLLI